MPRHFLLACCAALSLGGCAATSPDGARADANAILQLSRTEERFQVAMHELAQRQVDQDPAMKPFFGAIDDFWREQLRWPDVRERLVEDYLRLYQPAELRAIRQTLESPLGNRVLSHPETLNRQLAQRALATVQEKMPLLQQNLQTMQNALATGTDLTPQQDFLAVRERAAAGDAAAQLLLAEKLLAGVGTRRDLAQALQWMEKSAAQDNAPALDLLASFHYRGVGVARDWKRARELFERAVAHSYLPAMNNLAWLLATCPDDTLRDGTRAIALLAPVMDRSVQMLDTMAAAYAEAGRYDEAVEWQRQAIAGIDDTGDPRLPPALDRLQAYAAGKPWRDPRPDAVPEESAR